VDRLTLRQALIGAAVGAVLFGAVAVYRSFDADGTFLSYVGPVGVFTLIGFTVGGLMGPLAARATARLRGRRASPEGDGGTRTGGRGPGTGGGTPEEGMGEIAPRPPLWLHLVAGGAVGYGIGTAWDRIGVGIGLGVALALVARRIFRRQTPAQAPGSGDGTRDEGDRRAAAAASSSDGTDTKETP